MAKVTTSGEKIKAELKTAAFLEGQGTNLSKQSKAQNFREKSHYPNSAISQHLMLDG